MNSDVFLTLCQLSNTNNWCDDIGCTTCGNMAFRYAILCIIDEENLTSFLNNDLYFPSSKIKFKYKPRMSRGRFNLTEEESVKLASLIASTNLYNIAYLIKDEVRWLKALGVVLFYTQNSSEATRILSNSIAGQLSFISGIDFHYDLLSWKTLSDIHMPIKNSNIISKYYELILNESSKSSEVLSLSILDFEKVPGNTDIKVTYKIELTEIENIQVLDSSIFCQIESFTINYELEDLYDWEEVESKQFDIDDMAVSITAKEKYKDLVLSCFDYDELKEIIDNEEDLSNIVKEAYKLKKNERLSYDTELLESRKSFSCIVKAQSNFEVQVGQKVPDNIKYGNGMLIFNIPLRGGTHTQMKMNALKKKLDILEESGKIVFSASGGNSYEYWSEFSTVCILHLSKQEAYELLKWSESSFGLWCDRNSKVTILDS